MQWQQTHTVPITAPRLVAVVCLVLLSVLCATTTTSVRGDCGTLFSNSSVCTGGAFGASTSVEPSWCRARNPFSATPFQFGNKETDFVNPTYECESQDLWAQCASIVSISTGEFTIGDTTRTAAVFGFLDGSYALVDLNANEFVERGPTQMGPQLFLSFGGLRRWTATGGSMVRGFFCGGGTHWMGVGMMTESTPKSDHPHDMMLYGLAGYTFPNTTFIQSMVALQPMREDKFVAASFMIDLTVTFANQFYIQFSRFFEDSNDPRNNLLWKQYRSNVNTLGNVGLPVLSTVTHRIGIRSFEFFVPVYNHSHVVLMVRDMYSVYLYNYVDDDESLLLDYGFNDTSLFWTVDPNQEIISSSIFSEQVPRLNPAVFDNPELCPEHIFLQPSEMLWLALGIQTNNSDGTQSFHLLTVALEEFANLTRSDTPVMDVALRGTHNLCPETNQIRDWSGKCRNRVQYRTKLELKPSSLETRFKGPPEPFESYIEALQHLSLNTTCGMFRGYPDLEKACEEAEHDLWKELGKIKSCLTSTFFPNSGLFGHYSEDVVQKVMREYLYTTIFVISGQHVRIYAQQANLCTPQRSTIYQLNAIDFIGPVKTLAPSLNQQHLFVGITRRRWEIQSMQRYLEVCQTLQNSTSNSIEHTFLGALDDACKHLPPDTLKFTDFIQYTSLCPPGSYCPSLSLQSVSAVPTGQFTQQAIFKKTCPAGNICPGGVSVPCPQGYRCPFPGMTSPLACELNNDMNTTCYQYSSTQPVMCPLGFICNAEYFPPLPVPNSTFGLSSGSRREVYLCTTGEWCPLASVQLGNTSTGNLLSPPGYFTALPGDIEPVECHCNSSLCEYCPAGSFSPNLCPAGYYCTDSVTRVSCTFPDYCPNGTITPSICPAGFYCPHPSYRVLCPSGFFCHAGSLQPSRCPPLAVCSAGSSSATVSILGLVLDLVLFFTIVLFWWIYLYLQHRSKRVLKQAQASRSSPFTLPSQPLADTLADESTELLQVAADRNRNQLSYSTSSSPTVSSADQFFLDFEFIDLGLKLKSDTSKVVMAGVTGRIQHGSVTAVMGPSGAGKTTFLTTLSGKASYGIQTGTVLINGQERPIRDFKKVVGFVPQEDIMHRDLSVEETLMFHARMRLPRETSTRDVHRRVKQVLTLLGLLEIRNSPIGDEDNRGISGGQRKRVNIGMELIADCKCIFLDEPTSGLDSRSSMEVCDALRRIADTGVTIITVIHQPRYEIFCMFHRVLLLGKGGRVVFLGASDRAIEYFESIGYTCPPRTNPPDFFMDVIAGEVEPEVRDILSSELASLSHSEKLFTLWTMKREQYEDQPVTYVENDAQLDASSETSSTVRVRPQPPQRRTPGVLAQIVYFFARSLSQQTRDLKSLVIDFALVFIGGLFMGLVFNKLTFDGPPPAAARERCPPKIAELLDRPINDPIPTEASLTCLTIALTAVAAALRVFGAEKVNFWRENASGMSSFAYFIGKNLAYIPHSFLSPFIFLTIFYTLVNPSGSVVNFFVILFLVDFAAVGAAFMVSVLMPPSLSQLTAVLFVLMSAMVAGTFPTLKMLEDMFFPLNIAPNVSFLRWAQEAFYISEVQSWADVYDIRPGVHDLGYDLGAKVRGMVMVLAFGILFRIVAYVIMVVKDRDKRR